MLPNLVVSCSSADEVVAGSSIEGVISPESDNDIDAISTVKLSGPFVPVKVGVLPKHVGAPR